MRYLGVAVALCALLAGCGGGGGSAGSGNGGSGNTGGETPLTQNTTKFHVDVTTGKVTVIGGTPANRAIFSGTSVGFNSSVLLDFPGSDIGLKTLNVSLTNNFGLPLGVGPDGTATGMRVVFGSIVNLATPPVISGQTNVSTVAGTGSAGFADGSVSSATFTLPSAVISGGSGSLYVTDFTKGLIRKISSGQVTTLAGGGAAGVNGVGKIAGLVNPVGIAINPVDGAMVIAELGGNRIRRMTPAGSVSTIAGTGTASAVNGSGASATFNKPYAVAVDSTGTIYVSDFNNHVIRKIVFNGGAATSPSSYTVSTLSGSGVAGSADGPPATATFIGPGGIAFDPSSSALYLADTSANKIRRIDLAGNATTVAGTGAVTEYDGNGSTASFFNPRGILVEKGALIVSDGGGNSIRQISLIAGGSPNLSTSWIVQKLAGTGATGSSDGTGISAKFNGPLLIGTDASGNILVPDSANNKIRMVQPTNGLFPIGTTNGSAPDEPVQLSNPSGALDHTESGSNNPYITYPGTLAAGATSTPLQWNFVVPNGVSAFEFTVTVDTSISTLTAPISTSSTFGSSSVIVSTYAGISGSLGSVDGSTSEAQFANPISIAIDRAGVVYVGDLGLAPSIRRIGLDGRVSTIAGVIGSGFSDGPGNTALMAAATGLAASPDGTRLYFSDNNHIRVATLSPNADPTNSANWTVETIAGASTSGSADGLGTVATFNSPSGVALSPGGILYVAELFGNHIRRLEFIGGNPTSASSWQVTTLAGSGTAGDIDGTGTAASFEEPTGIACDTSGNVYVAESGNDRVRKVSPVGVVTTLAGGVSGDTPVHADVNGPGATARFHGPEGVAVDSAGYVYAVEYTNSDIRRISPQGVTTTVAGAPPATGFLDGPGNVALFKQLRGVVVSPAGNLFVADENNGCIREIERNITSGTQ